MEWESDDVERYAHWRLQNPTKTMSDFINEKTEEKQIQINLSTEPVSITKFYGGFLEIDNERIHFTICETTDFNSDSDSKTQDVLFESKLKNNISKEVLRKKIISEFKKL